MSADPVRRLVFHVMGLPVSLALRGTHAYDAAADAAWERVRASLVDADDIFSTYRPDSVISRLSRGELTLDDCPDCVDEVLALGARAEAESGGAFAVRRTGPDGVTVLDPSGVVKGWAVERAARELQILTGTDYCLNAGGDLVCRTVGSSSLPWQIGIEDPVDPHGLIATVPVRHGAVATSGSAHRGSHIVDARTGSVPTTIAQVTVLYHSLTWADIDATAAYALDSQALAWLRGRPGRTGVVVWRDGRAETFSGPRESG